MSGAPVGGLALAWLCISVALSAATAWTDWRWRRVPNWILAGLLVGWVVAAACTPAVLGGAPLASLLGGAVCLLVGFILYSVGWLGGGDGKLLAVLGLWLGVEDLGFALLAAAALLLLLWNVAVSESENGNFRSRGIPFACALAPPSAVLLGVRAIELNGW